MKNLVITVLVLILLVIAYVGVSSLRVSGASREGELVTIQRGDLTLPINATGEIQAARSVEIKSEASGEVIEITRQPGERVGAGETLIRLQPDDEQRNVRRAELGVIEAKAGLEEAKNLLQQARGADITTAKANVERTEAALKVTLFKAERVIKEPSLYHEEERLQRISNRDNELAQLESAKAALEKAELAIPRAEQAVKRAEARYETAQNNLADAMKRLSKTDIISPIDGVVARMDTQIGEVIQGGKSTFTGGTVLAVVLDMSKLILQAEVDEADIGRVTDLAPAWAKPGHGDDVRMPEDLSRAASSSDRLATIKVETFPKEVFQGVIERIHPLPNTNATVTTYLVDVVIISANKKKLLSGMRAEVEFTSEHVTNVVLCPNDAIRRNSDGQLGVYVPGKGAGAHDGRQVDFVPCELGISDGAVTEVVAGLSEGTSVYTKMPMKQKSDKQ